MSLISKIFGTKTNTRNWETLNPNHEATTSETQQVNIPPVDLFIDHEVPTPEQQVVAETQSMITAFLNRNYHPMGINDGYEYHSNETLETGEKRIRAEFQLIIDQVLQEKSERRLQLKNLIVDVKSVSEEARQRLENTIEEINSSLMILQKQKELSAENEGWVMNAIHSYHQGFVKGLNDFIAGENLLNSIKNV